MCLPSAGSDDLIHRCLSGRGGSYNEIEAAITAALASSTVLGGHLGLVWLGISPDMGNLIYVAQDDRARPTGMRW